MLSATAALNYHAVAGPTEVYVVSEKHTDPDIPGAGKPTYAVIITVKTSDKDAVMAGIYCRVLLADGTQAPLRSVVTHTTGTFTKVRFELGEYEPVDVDNCMVTRLHPEQTDILITPDK